MSGNQDFFDSLTDAAQLWARLNGTRRAETFDLLLAHLIETAASLGIGKRQTKYLTVKIATYWSHVVGRGSINTPQGWKHGGGMWPETPAELRRPYAAAGLRSHLVDHLVPFIVDRHESSRRRLARGETVDAAHVAGEGPRGRLSVRQIIDQARRTGHSPSTGAVHRALAKVEGMPRRDAKLAALSRPARDLLTVLEELPKSIPSLVSVDSVIAKLWTCAKVKALGKLRAAIGEINAAKIGTNLLLNTEGLFVAKGRRVPYSAMEGLRVRMLSPGLMSSRAGLWGSDEGAMAQDMVQHFAQNDDRVYLWGMARLTGGVAYSEGELLEEEAHRLLKIASDRHINEAQRGQAQAKADDLCEHLSRRRASEELNLPIIERGYAENRLAGAWRAAAKLATLTMASDNEPGAKGRIERIGRAFDRCRDAVDAASLIEHMAIRPQLRGEWQRPSDTKWPKWMHPRPMPRIDRYAIAKRIAAQRGLAERRKAIVERAALYEAEWGHLPDFLRPSRNLFMIGRIAFRTA